MFISTYGELLYGFDVGHTNATATCSMLRSDGPLATVRGQERSVYAQETGHRNERTQILKNMKVSNANIIKF